jgi:pimeloyl-ACP methyl ester carboxylesterase
MPDEVTPFRVAVPEDELADLRDRLRRTRWPEAETVTDWSQGIPLAYTRELCDYWADRYDWRACESRLNAIPQFRKFLDVVEPLADPTAHGASADDAFHVICPSLPGYGFSDRPAAAGWNTDRIARAWAQLMARLGYDRYGAQGGDWGAAVTASIGQQDVAHVAGIHLNMPMVGADRTTLESLTPQEEAALAAMAEHRAHGTGYSTQQSTRPQTLGYGLVDSPAGQCAWIVEKFWAWTDCHGHPENALTRDQMLDNVSVYWHTATGASSARLYWESFGRTNRDAVTVPAGCSIFPGEIYSPSRRWAERRYPDLRYWNELDRGGHFAAFEQPALFVEEMRAFFRLVR